MLLPELAPAVLQLQPTWSTETGQNVKSSASTTVEVPRLTLSGRGHTRGNDAAHALWLPSVHSLRGAQAFVGGTCGAPFVARHVPGRW